MAKKTKEPKKNLKTRIAILLDSSGSMASIRKEAMDMFNQQVRAIKDGAKGVDTTVSLAVFSTTTKTVFFNEEVSNLKELTLEAYVPEGGTAMYDSVGGAIDALSFLPESGDENTSFLVVIISDGQENSSQLYNTNDIAKRIQRLQQTNRWTFSYLGANQDLSKVAQQLNIPIGNTFSYLANSSGVGVASTANSLSTTSYMGARTRGVSSTQAFYNPANSGAQGQNTGAAGGLGGPTTGAGVGANQGTVVTTTTNPTITKK